MALAVFGVFSTTILPSSIHGEESRNVYAPWDPDSPNAVRLMPNQVGRDPILPKASTSQAAQEPAIHIAPPKLEAGTSTELILDASGSMKAKTFG